MLRHGHQCGIHEDPFPSPRPWPLASTGTCLRVGIGTGQVVHDLAGRKSRASNAKLLATGFSFEHDRLPEALEDLLG